MSWKRSLTLVVIVGVLFVTAGVGTVAGQSAPDCSAVTYNGDGIEANPYEVGNVEQLQCIEEQDLNANYKQVSDIDALETAVWNENKGFDPIGERGLLFNGTFDGAGNEITGLTIDTINEDAGMFSNVGPPGTVTNVSVRQVDITGPRVGGVVGVNLGTVRGSSASGTVESSFSSDAGGLVGSNLGTVRDSSASVDVTAPKEGGGLVGFNEGIVRDSSASGEVTGPDIMGGLVGQNRGGIVRGSSASGDVTGGGGIGGLVGFNDGGIVRDSSASGNVEGDELVGGLVGESTGDSVLRGSSASGNVEGEIDVGGLVGKSTGDSVLRSSSASGDVTASGFHVGGLVGLNEEGTVRDSSASGNVEGDEDVGGLVGNNNEEGTVEMSSATGNVTGNVSVGGLVGGNLDTVEKSYAMGASFGFEEKVGGLIGSNRGTVEDSYARGAVSSFGENIGGLVGRNGGSGITGTVRRSYATGNVTSYFSTPDPIDPEPPFPEPISVEDSSTSTGGLVGNNNEGPVSDSYWDMNTTGLEVSDGGTGLRTAEMTGSAATNNMQGFDFTDVWQTVSGDYPALAWQTEQGSPVEGVSNELWTAVTQNDNESGLSLADLGNAIQVYQNSPGDADIDGVSIGLSDLGALIQHYQNEVA